MATGIELIAMMLAAKSARPIDVVEAAEAAQAAAEIAQDKAEDAQEAAEAAAESMAGLYLSVADGMLSITYEEV